MKNLLFSFFQQPYESINVEENQDIYLQHEWTMNGEAIYGLALASIMESAGLSLPAEEWNKSSVNIWKDSDFIEVKNIYNCDSADAFLYWLQDRETPVLKETSIDPTNKSIKLRDDHGKDTLLKFAKRIIRSPYVEGVINSLPFQPRNREFIHAIKEEGIIEIVLPWTEEGIGLVVKTTGKSRRETQEIANILKKEYCKVKSSQAL